MDEQAGGAQPQQDDGEWRAMDLFELLLESSDPEAVLAAEPDAEVREQARRLWQHHLRAGQEEFLEQCIDFEVLPAFQVGQLLQQNRFEVIQALGRGGMGEAYLAYDRKLGGKVALKTIARMLASSEFIRLRFMAEVQNARRITHPHVCRIHEIFDEGKIVFFAMEYVEGLPLSQLVQQGCLGKKAAWEIATQLADGLYAAHRSGVVHGDFKPSNVLVTPGDPQRAVIMDFGLAQAIGGGATAGEAAGGGTLSYMAPELLAGASPTVASDIFAFGKAGAELLPGEKIWEECTRKDAGARPATLEPVIRHLRRASTRRYWLGGGLVTGLTVAALRIWWPDEPALRIEAGAKLLVNGFQAAAGSAAGARLLRALLITALQQSPRLRAIADQDLVPLLRRLGPEVSLPAQGVLLRNLLKAQRASYWMDGQMRPSGGRLSLSVSLLRASDERLLAQTDFGDSPSVADLAERTAGWIRQLAGESQQSLASNPAKVTAYTSAVPEALQKYYEAMEHYAAGEMEAAVPGLEEAIRLDENFAQAHNALGMCLNSQWRHMEALEHVERARQLAGKLPARERAWIEAFYQELVEDPVKMVEATRRNLEYHRDEPRFYRILAQTLCWVGRAQEALPHIQKAVELGPEDELLRNEQTEMLCEAGLFEAALANYRQARQAGMKHAYLHRGEGIALLGLERYGEAERAFEAVNDGGELLIPAAKILAGNLESAVACLKQEQARQRAEQNAALEHRVHEFLCGTYYLTDQIEAARKELGLMTTVPECPAFAARLQCTAFWAARLRMEDVLGQVQSQLENIERRWPNGTTHAIATYGQALRAWQRGAAAEVGTLLLDSLGSAFTIWALFDLADCYATMAKPALAEEYWVKFEARRGTVLKHWFPGTILYGWLNRALAAVTRGEAALAARCAGKILRHWSESNPRTHIVQAAKAISSNSQRS